MGDPALEALLEAMAAETRLADRCRLLALTARKEGRPALGSWLEAQALSRQTRAQRLGRLARGKTGRDLAEALAALDDDLAHMAETYARLAQVPEAPPALGQSARVEKLAPGQLRRLRDQEPPAPAEPWRVCTVCGFLKQGPPPDRCPVCGAVRERFHGLEE